MGRVAHQVILEGKGTSKREKILLVFGIMCHFIVIILFTANLMGLLCSRRGGTEERLITYMITK
jgi:hypothetical protein